MDIRSALLLLVLSCVDAALPSSTDLIRAKTWKPRSGFRGSGSLISSNAQLNRHLTKTKGLNLKACEDFSVSEVRDVLRTLFDAASDELKEIYHKADGRSAVYKTTEEMEAHWKTVSADGSANDTRVRDAHCHEAVMWFVHHLTEDTKRLMMEQLTLPRLPDADHRAKSLGANDAVGDFYTKKVTCQQCHINGLDTLGAPEVKPTTAKQLARRCYTNYKDLFNLTCGPCDGVAGEYWGDDDDKFSKSDRCVVVGKPEEIAESDRVKAALPNQFSVDVVVGYDRWGRTTNPAVSPKTGLPTWINTLYGRISGRWFVDMTPDSDLWMLRHDTSYADLHHNGTAIPFVSFHVSEIHAQTKEMQLSNLTGPMVSLVDGIPNFVPGGCTCVADPVGQVDVTMTRLDGLKEFEYLGRIKLSLDELDGSVVELDHWASWFFHIFMDTNTSSPYYGKAPKRLASAYAGTAVYDNWVFADPKIADPTVWYRGIPKTPERVGPDHGKYCLNPQKISVCNNISQTTFPPAPASSDSKSQQLQWEKIHEHFLPSLHQLRSNYGDMMTAQAKEVFV